MVCCGCLSCYERETRESKISRYQNIIKPNCDHLRDFHLKYVLEITSCNMAKIRDIAWREVPQCTNSTITKR